MYILSTRAKPWLLRESGATSVKRKKATLLPSLKLRFAAPLVYLRGYCRTIWCGKASPVGVCASGRRGFSLVFLPAVWAALRSLNKSR